MYFDDHYSNFLRTYCLVSTHSYTASNVQSSCANRKARFPIELPAQLLLTSKHKVQNTILPHDKFHRSHAKTLTGNLEWKSLARQAAALLEKGCVQPGQPDAVCQQTEVSLCMCLTSVTGHAMASNKSTPFAK